MGAFSHVSSSTIRPETLIRAIGTERAPLLIDVRRRAAFDKSDSVLPAAFWRDHRDAPTWAHRLEAAAGGRGLVVYCVHGEQVSLAAASLLRQAGVSAKVLIGGFDGYVAAGGPLVDRTDNDRSTPSRWATGERPGVARLACAWFIRRFVDPLAEIHFVDQAWATAVAAEIGAVAFDVDGGEIAREGPASCLDTMLTRYSVVDPPLLRLAEIVRVAETARHDLAPQAAGLQAMALGLSAGGRGDPETMERGFVLLDALYDWARFAPQETQGGAMPAGAGS